MSGRLIFETFRSTFESVPAYRTFLKDQGFDVGRIKSPKDIVHVPLTSKAKYLNAYSPSELTSEQTRLTTVEYCATSGSTGEPYYFPRTDKLAEQYAVMLRDYLLQSDPDVKKRTLVLIGFGMGVWIGGVITLRAFEIAGKKYGYPLSILPVGYNKAEMLKAMHKLSPQFDQTILVGYPPFIKQIVDQASTESIDLESLRVRFIFAAEGFTENFRDYLCERTGANPLIDTLNIYGTADIGAMAYETPLSILIRRIATKDSGLFADIFGQIIKTPTLAQYNPRFIAFESIEDSVVLTGSSALPLVRYEVGDHGGVFTFGQMKKIFKRRGYDLTDEMIAAGISGSVKKYPFVYVYERANFSTTLHGINIYPEFIKEGLIAPKVSKYVTGRFTMITRLDDRQDQFLEVNVEQYGSALPSSDMENLLLQCIEKSLSSKSSEFKEISKSSGVGGLVRIVLWPQDDPKYFPAATKQRWAIQAE